MRSLTRKINQITAKLLDLPQDVALDLPRITMIGNMQLYIENHRGVIHFSDESLKLALPNGKLEVVGSNLVIRAIMPDEVMIEGTIRDVQYML
ncbi:sporulation protein YqfC [Paenibacillus sp. UNCCL117]|uniref:sporulation protein YqfC n=1 Tax=unclassified Paenibacillus TaxID=185978 RepID=UPI000886EE21|nr:MULTISPECIES: sporulation protein YqfC [unclassified Paenibacillus]SDC72350.1 sporulation protein YqfC [Paenibacillus sp. cl123]SFW24739.1 sporulation protein YqfC [Paenibacillus sp. UNCCL117]